MSAATVVTAKSSVFLAMHLSHKLNVVLGHAFPVADAFDAVSVKVVERFLADSGPMENSSVPIFAAAVFQIAFTNHEFVSTNNCFVVAHNYCELASHVRGSRRVVWLSDLM